MNIAIILAGGVGSRMKQAGLPKQFLMVFGKPIVAHTLQIFEDSEYIDKIVVVCKSEYIHRMEEIVRGFNFQKVNKIVPGGETGQASVWQGLIASKEFAVDESIVVIHDAVRPFISSDLLDASIEKCIRFGNSVAAAPAIETIGISGNGKIIDTIEPRQNCYILKAPQCFKYKDLLSGHLKARDLNRNDFIDSASLVRELLGMRLNLIECPKSNIKVTTPEDFYVLRSLFELKETIEVFGQ